MMQWVKKIHKWVSLLIGLQVFIWVLSGLIFNVIDHNKARGNTYRQAISAKQNIIAEKDLLPVESILAAYPDTIELTQTTLLSKPLLSTNKRPSSVSAFCPQLPTCERHIR